MLGIIAGAAGFFLLMVMLPLVPRFILKIFAIVSAIVIVVYFKARAKFYKDLRATSDRIVENYETHLSQMCEYGPDGTENPNYKKKRR